MSGKKKDRHGHPKFYTLLEEIADLHDRKNEQYASSDRPLGNFERGSQMCKALFHPDIQADPYKLQLAYCIVLASKQIDGAIEILAHDKRDTPDSLREKIRDVITYFGIADCIDSDRIERDQNTIGVVR